MRRLAISLLSIALVLLVTPPGFAQDAALQTAPAQAAPAEAPPALVGRVSFLSGKLAFHMPGETQWSAAKVNYPVAAGASFWTAPQARAEFRIGPQTIGISGNTALDIAELDHKVMRLALSQGRINLHLREIAEGGSVQVDIPGGEVRLLQPGIYDIDAGGQDKPARIAAFEGNARFVGGGTDLAVKTGDAAVIGGADTAGASVERAVPDEFAEWCRSRDYDQRRLAAPRRVSPRVTGYETLDGYGTWRPVAQFGEVWVPNAVPPGWAPYRHGHWVWVPPWGWTWVDDEPWGFAPSHYGRWAYADDLWVWVPGPVVPQPVYAPALVAFVDDPALVVATRLRAPLVGWFPLGPGEPYWPAYTGDPGYIQALNAGFVRDAAALDRAMMAAAANRFAATVVPQRAFARADKIARAALKVSDQALKDARVAKSPPGLKLAGVGRGKAGREAAALAGPGIGRERFAGPPGRGRAAAMAERPPKIGRPDKAARGGPHEARQLGGPKHAAGADRAERGRHEGRKGGGGPKHAAGTQKAKAGGHAASKGRGGPKHVAGPQKARGGGGPKHTAGPPKAKGGGPKHAGGGPKHAGGGKGGGGGPKHFGGGKGPGGHFAAGGGGGKGGGGGGKGGGGKGGGGKGGGGKGGGGKGGK